MGELGAAVTALVGLLGVVALVASLLGVRVVPVLTGSMSPTVPAGSLALTTRVDAHDIAVGQVIAFRPPPPYVTQGDRPVMHRVAAVSEQGGQRTVRTRGDANPDLDPWTLAITDGTDLGLAQFSVPHLGRVLAGGPLSAGLLLAGVVLLLAAVRRARGSTTVPGCTCKRTHATLGHERT
ncbi:signal peptidase I [Kineococcus sp. GCM10028916]|uniref:signal peptidase I n=1 Tax=Kineococcus sp. GCM10028916 TaxID=3273394 RepID=UPI0036402E02